jgi:fructose-1-phosphate kinase PfkB-like protein
MGVQWVVVSIGEQGIIVVTDEVSLAASIKHESKEVISTIGCGDALVAGLAVAMLCKKSLREVIKSGISCATANLYSNEPGRVDPLLVETLQKDIIIRSL